VTIGLAGINRPDYSSVKLNLLCSRTLTGDESDLSIQRVASALRGIGCSKGNNPDVSVSVLGDNGVEENASQIPSPELFALTVVLLDEQQYERLCQHIEEHSNADASIASKSSLGNLEKQGTHLSDLDHFVANAMNAGQSVLPVCVDQAPSRQLARFTVSLRLRRQVSLVEIRQSHLTHDIELLLAAVLDKTVASQQAVDQADTAGVVQLNSDNAYPAKRYKPKDQVSAERLGTVTAQELNQWSVVETQSTGDKDDKGRQQLTREYRFDTFRLAIAFMERVATGCDIADHHPDWSNTHKSLTVSLSTWDAQYPCITERDLALATYMDRAFEAFWD